MPTYLEIFNFIYASPDLEKQLVIACLKAADMIFQEADTTENHVERLRWAKAVAENPLRVARLMMPTITTNGTVQSGEYTDTDLQWIVETFLINYIDIV